MQSLGVSGLPNAFSEVRPGGGEAGTEHSVVTALSLLPGSLR